MMSVTKIFEFAAAHHLPGHEGKCANVHGHTYTVEVEFMRTAGILSQKGMVIDFDEVSEQCKPVIDALDHRDLNAIMPMPTAENIAEWLAEKLGMIFTGEVEVIRVRVWESPRSYAEWIP